jgi:UDP-N-acetylmuramate dehydrogenase
MMNPHPHRLIERLPPVRGRYTENAPLKDLLWFRVGGPAELLFEPEDERDLATFLAERPDDTPVNVIGGGANLLVRDLGIPGVVIRLGPGFGEIEVASHEVRAGAAALLGAIARAARDAEIEGLEFLSGIPGTLGGALRMNAGAFGSEMREIVVEAVAMDRNGNRHHLDREALGFAYRHCSVSEDWIFTGAHLRGRPGKRREIMARMQDIHRCRKGHQPLGVRTGGSTFKNPSGENPSGGKAWELIAKAGCRGLSRGDAVVSDKHCNFLINTGRATAADIEGLGEEVRRRVRETCGVELEWEIRRIGKPRAGLAEGEKS